MSNGQLHDDKLFQGLHDRLSDYEAPYNGADWDAMNRSLDKLPKTNQFRWKFSLNTIGIMLGIVGLTAVGIVIAAGRDKAAVPADNINVTVTTPAPPATVNTVQPQAQAPAPSPATTAVNAPGENVTALQMMNSHKDLNNPNRNNGSNNVIPFRLGDQIDPVKGVVKQTTDDPAMMKDHSDMKQPEVYYDIDENGKIKPIIIKHDSDTGAQEIKQDSLPQPPVNGPEPTAPTEGQRIGFDSNNP